ncbi:MAG: hypothetical protein Fur0041_19970 [Bacteroidia bacterium]
MSPGICPGGTMPFNSSTTVSVNGPIVTYHWDFGLVPLTNDTSNLANPSYSYPNAGTYPVILFVTDSFGCSDSVMQNVIVYELPQIQFTGGPLSGCSPLCVNFTDQTTVTNSSAAQWLWNFGDGGIDSIQNPQHCFINQGQYTITLTVTSQEGCVSTDSIPQYIDVIPGPVAAFTFSPQPTTLNNSTIYFTDQSTNGGVEWTWYFDENGSSSTLQNPSYTYQDTGTFNVMMIVSAAGGACPDTAYGEVFIAPELLVWIPNTFTPNSNGNNDIFIPVFSAIDYITAYEMYVFDRWGNLIFQTKDPLKGWDGQYKGKLVQEDTYVYKIWVRDLDGKSVRFIGGVNVIR